MSAPAVKFPPNVIQTFSGEGYDFADPAPESVKLKDIAHALSNMCRFAGHVSRFYSVAEHCVLVSRIMEARGQNQFYQELGLLHDAHEAYVWDCPRPFKPLLGDTFEKFADLADEAIMAALMPPETTAKWFHCMEVKDADDTALVAEARELMHHGPESWDGWIKRYQFIGDIPKAAGIVRGWPPETAEAEYLKRAQELGIKENV